MQLGLKGKKAIVSAASKGLGKACAFSLAREGVDVTIMARTKSDLESTAMAFGISPSLAAASGSGSGAGVGGAGGGETGAFLLAYAAFSAGESLIPKLEALRSWPPPEAVS